MIVNGEFFYEKSHLCGVKTCENWYHVVFESAYLNSQRKHCNSGAKLCRCYPRCLTNPGFVFVPLVPGGNPADPYVPGYWADPGSVDFNLLFDIYEMANRTISPPSLLDIDPRNKARQAFLEGYIDFPITQEPSPPRGPPTPWPRLAIPCVVDAIATWHSHHRYRDLRSRVPPLREIERALKDGAAWSNVLLYLTLRDTALHPAKLSRAVHQAVRDNPTLTTTVEEMTIPKVPVKPVIIAKRLGRTYRGLSQPKASLKNSNALGITMPYHFLFFLFHPLE